MYLKKERDDLLGVYFGKKSWVGGGGGTLLQEAHRDVPLDGVGFSRLN